MDDGRSDVEREIEARLEDPTALGRPLSRRTLQTQRSLEAYLKGGNLPRWMARLGEIDRGIAAERRALARAYRALREEHGDDREAFARRWRTRAARWRFDHLNDLIRQHNEWYPIERDLPMDLRTRDYVLVNGHSYRRPELDAAWVLEQFPASP
jgi:hypothetical protein